jgi:hypothetical protein
MLSNNQNKQDQKSTLLLSLILYSLMILIILLIQLLILPFFFNNNLKSATTPSSNQYQNHLKPLTKSSPQFKFGTYKAIWNFYSNIPTDQQNSYLINLSNHNNYYSSNYGKQLFTGTYKLDLNKQANPTLTIKESIFQRPSEQFENQQVQDQSTSTQLIHYLTIGTINHYLRPNTYLISNCRCIQFTDSKLQQPSDHLDPFLNSNPVDLLLIYLKPEPTRFPDELSFSINRTKQIE